MVFLYQGAMQQTQCYATESSPLIKNRGKYEIKTKHNTLMQQRIQSYKYQSGIIYI